METQEFLRLWQKGIDAQAEAEARSKAKKGDVEYEVRRLYLDEVDDVVRQILGDEDAIYLVSLELVARRGGSWQVLQLVYDNQTLKIPWPMLGENLQKKVRKHMSINTIFSNRTNSRLLDGLSLSEAVAFYRRLMQELETEDETKDGDTVYGFVLRNPQNWVVYRRNTMDPSQNFEHKVFMSTVPGRQSKDVLQDVFGNMLHIEMWAIASLALAEESFEVFVQDTTKNAPHRHEAVGYEAAYNLGLSTSRALFDHERGNAHVNIWLKCQYGTFEVPAFGRPFFVPAGEFAPKITEERFGAIVTRRSRAEIETRKLVKKIHAAARRDWSVREFEGHRFERDFQPAAYWHISGFNSLTDAYEAGLLTRWVEYIESAAKAKKLRKPQS